MIKNNVEALKAAYAKLKEEQPRLRQRNAAEALGVSEAELLGIQLSETCIRLEGRFQDLLKEVHRMGEVMALTRNESVVHERKGVYDNISFYGPTEQMGVAVNPDIDLRFFMSQWKYGFAVEVPRGKEQIMYSFQFFNQKGEAVHKIYSTKSSDIEAYRAIVAQFKASAQVALDDVDHSEEEKVVEQADSAIDVEGFKQAWTNLEDTHDFFAMLKKYEVSRLQGLRLAPEGMCQAVAKDSVIDMLEKAAARALPIMVFVHSKGCVQIHTGEVKKLVPMDQWYNIMDPKFNMHLRLDHIEQAWIVRKPTKDGIVTSLELFDANGELIVYFFGKRKPGQAELEAWRVLIDELATSTVA